MFNLKSNIIVIFIFRPHTSAPCYQLGYVQNGVVTGTSQGSCSSGRPAGGVWFNVCVEVSLNSATIRLNDVVVTSTTPHFPILSATGVIAANGYRNVISYKKCLLG